MSTTKKDEKNWMCNHCYHNGDKEVFFDTSKELIKHYRKFHPNDSEGLFDILGRTGDKFSEAVITRLEGQFKELGQKHIELDREHMKLQAAHKELETELAQCRRVIKIVQLVMGATS